MEIVVVANPCALTIPTPSTSSTIKIFTYALCWNMLILFVTLGGTRKRDVYLVPHIEFVEKTATILFTLLQFSGSLYENYSRQRTAEKER